MPYFIQVGFHKDRKKKYTQQGVHCYRRGCTVIRRWGRIETSAKGTITFPYGVQFKIDEFNSPEAAKIALDAHCVRYEKEGFSRLPKGKKIES